MIETKHWLFESINEWRQLFGKYNWYTCTIIEIYFENDKFTHGCEARVVVLGLGIRIRYNSDKAIELFEQYSREAEKFMNEKV